MTRKSDGLVRVCLVGTGRAGMVHARNFRTCIPGASLVSVVDPNLAAASKAAAELEIDTIFDNLDTALSMADFDAVCIGAPTFTHADIAVKAARAGKHILCEKPMAVTLEECDKMIAAAQEAGVVLQVGFMRRFDEDFVAAKRAVERGDIGEPVLVKSLTRGPGLPAAWYFDIDKSNGLLAEVNSHDFDTVLWFMESGLDSVYAQAGNFKCHDLAQEYPRLYDYATVSLRFDNGRMGFIDGGCPVGYGYDARLEIVGTEGVVFAGKMIDESVTVCTKANGVVKPISSGWRRKFKDAYVKEDMHFVGCVQGGHEPAATGEDGKNALRAVLASNLSIKEKRPVALSELPK
jgi:predicted dehydrogenase